MFLNLLPRYHEFFGQFKEIYFENHLWFNNILRPIWSIGLIENGRNSRKMFEEYVET